MSAIVIYPVAFKGNSAVVQSALSATQDGPAAPYPLRQPCATASPVGAVHTVRAAAGQSANCLHHAESHLEGIRANETAMVARSQEISDASKTLGLQMERLIEETRRMVSYLRNEQIGC